MRAAGAKFKERKRKEAAPAKSRLVGAALQAVARREERERLAMEAARAELGEEAAEADEVKQEANEVELKEADGADEKATGVDEQQGQSDAPKREIPTCKSVLQWQKCRSASSH